MTDPKEIVIDNSMVTNLLEVIGRGIDFPVKFTQDRKVGTIATNSAEDCINDSIHLILSTRPGERVMNPEFGSRLPSLVFEPNDDILAKLLKIYTADALSRWEKRIEIVQVSVIQNLNNDAARVGVEIFYTIRNSHVAGSYVYPFTREGMLTSDLYTGSEAGRMMNTGSVVL